jgi:signal transduction histidine kinase
LSVVKAVVEAHGGRATVASAAGQGSEFTVTLPG